jgi:hypothetical protein
MTNSKRTLALASDAPPGERMYWVVPGWFLAGAYPSARDGTDAARRERIAPIWNAGVRTFVSLVEDDERPYGKPFASYSDVLDAMTPSGAAPAACLRFGVVDGGLPSSATMRSVLDAIDLSLEAGRPLYIHCFGGMGRTATAVGCWLLRHGLASPSDVFDVITRLRQADVTRRDRPAPEPSQRAFVSAWPRGA